MAHFTGRIPILSSNYQCQITETKQHTIWFIILSVLQDHCSYCQLTSAAPTATPANPICKYNKKITLAKMTARCAQYVSALKIVGLCIIFMYAKSADDYVHYNLITIRWGGKIIFEVFHPMRSRHLVT